MSPLYDDRSWRPIREAAEFIAKQQETINQVQRNADSIRNAQRAIDALNIVSPMLSAFKFLPNDLVDRYIEQLHSDLDQEPEEHEVLEYPETELLLPETRERIITYSPSLRLLEQLRAQRISLHDLTWRDFEEVVAELLRQDGYMVQLGPGTKDGGKDIIAIKEDRVCGLVMSVWQAKMLTDRHKVGIEVIRELADTRQESKASKGVIVTSTSLTKGALERIERDHFLLHKIDGNDLLKWIRESKGQA